VELREAILAVDVGSGTQDILVWEPGIPMESSPKLVLPSSTTILARLIEDARSKGLPIFLTGHTMGGGPCSSAVRKHLQTGLRVFALEKPALTFHDDLEKVKAMGIEIVDGRPDMEPLRELPMGDIDLPSIANALAAFHVALPGIVAVSVQDHGFSPHESNRAFRFKQWADLLRRGNGLETLLYKTAPQHLTRMRAVQEAVPGAWVMDTGASAILGALLDPRVAEQAEAGITVVNVGNEHTVAALVKARKIWGIYEHHTSLLEPSRLSQHLDRFRRGELTNQEIFDEMGHGCWVLPEARGASAFEHLSLTGPNRERFAGLRGHMAAPFGDMMLTGCFGLVEAVRQRLKDPNQ
jgi:uncharacterized protein (DUF1786 family)